MSENLNAIDYTVIAVYFSFLVGLGLYLKKRASASIEDYFLGGRKLPWWALGVSGMASFLDITGTMLIVSFLYMLGPRGLFIEFRGGAVLVLIFMMLWTGKWHRRSNCMTGAEWNIYRFGSGAGGQFARVVSAIATMAFAIGMLAYMVKGVGLFLSTFVPLPPIVCAALMIGIAMLYTMASGFYGVVYTDLFQSLIILFAVITISFMAIDAVAGSDQTLPELAREVTGSTQWMSAAPHTHTEMPDGYKDFEPLLFIMLFYLLRNVLGGMASGQDPKYFGARNERECGLLTFLWTWLMMFRWPMMIGFAVLGLFLVRDLFPDPTVLKNAEFEIKSRLIELSGEDIDFNDKVAVARIIPKNRWDDTLAGIDEKSHPALVATLKQADCLGEDWRSRLKFVSYEGNVNAERILPMVMLYKIRPGLRGLLLIALIAASMSTFDSTVNNATGYFTRDIYQAYLRPKAGNRELIYASYAFGLVIVACGFTMGYFAEDINDIWDWIIMGLGAGLMIPGILRLYWWRFNASGVVVGTLTGLLGAVCVRVLQMRGTIDADPVTTFVTTTLIGFSGAIIGTYITEPTDARVLRHFYKTTRPFGLWGRFKGILDPQTRAEMQREHFFDLISVPFAFFWQVTLFLTPMLLVVGNYKVAGVSFAVFAAALTGLYFFWYRQLPPPRPVPVIAMSADEPSSETVS